MNCACACHDAGWVPHCPYCQISAAPAPKMWLTPADLKKLNAEITMEDTPGINAFTVRLVLTPPGPFTLAAQFNQQQYGCAIGLSKELFAQDYLTAVEQAEIGLCKEMSAYFHKAGWPSWVFVVLEVDGPPEPMVQSAYTLPHWGHKWANVGKGYVGGKTVVDDLTFLLPGLREIVRCPATLKYRCTPCALTTAVCTHGQDEDHRRRCPEHTSVKQMIVHLNDQHRWSREVEIADWLESLDVDLSFPSEEEIAQRKAERTAISDHVDALAKQYLPSTPISAVTNMVKEIYAKQIAYQQDQVELFTASWHEKEPGKLWHKQSVTFDIHNHQAGLDEVADKMNTGNHVKFIDDLQLEKHLKVPMVYFDGEWLDKPAVTVDPLEFKKVQAKHHQKFLHNPTKSKPPKKN